MRHRGEGGRGTSGRGIGRRRMRRSLAGTCGVEEAGAPMGEAMGGGGRGTMLGGVRSGDVGLGGVGSSRGVSRATWGQESRCRSGSMRSVGWAGRVDACGVGRLSARGSVDRLDRWV
jgi:hypothetical protein